MTMIDKVTDAINRKSLECDGMEWMKFCNELAKAAIEAMQEPTDEMLQIECGCGLYSAVGAYKQLIAAALKED